MESPETPAIIALQGNFRQPGTVQWIGLRPAPRATMDIVQATTAIQGQGLQGDRAVGKSSAKRQVTLIMGEHLDAAAAILGLPSIDPGLIRRNIVTRGVNLMAMKGKKFRVGNALLQLTDPCYPCTRMEENLGPGGFNAMRGHGGWCAIILQGGDITLGDTIAPDTNP